MQGAAQGKLVGFKSASDAGFVADLRRPDKRPMMASAVTLAISEPAWNIIAGDFGNGS